VNIWFSWKMAVVNAIVNVNVIDFAIASLKKVPQRCCDLQHDAQSRD